MLAQLRMGPPQPLAAPLSLQFWVRGYADASYLAKDEVTDRVLSIVKNFGKVEAGKVRRGACSRAVEGAGNDAVLRPVPASAVRAAGRGGTLACCAFAASLSRVGQLLATTALLLCTPAQRASSVQSCSCLPSR